MGTLTGTQTDLRMEATGTGDLPNVARNACGGRSDPEPSPVISTNKPHRLRQRIATYSTAARKPARTGGYERGITRKCRPPGLIAERIEAQAVPPPYTMSPGSRSTSAARPCGCRGFPPLSPDGGSPVDVRRLGRGASLRHRQNYVR